MYGTGDYVDKNALKRERPNNDHFFGAVHELYCETSHIWHFFDGIFPELCGVSNDFPLCAGYAVGYFDRPHYENGNR